VNAAGVRGKMNNAFDPSRASGLSGATRSMVERRAAVLAPTYRLFYEEPLEVVRGSGTHLYDRDGVEYLDAYNNVVSVGHAHPRVVAAVHEQMKALCTHTRYLQDGILDYAEDLLGTFSGPLGAEGRAVFTCTGSEANDLALRVAKHVTGRRGVIVTAEAYHGNSDLVSGISPSLGEYSPLGTWTRQVRAPDSYRLSADEIREGFVADVRHQIADLERHGDGVAALIVDPIFSSDGIYATPTDFLAPAVEAVRAAGGIFIADEVQSGFGRTGAGLWGYSRHGVDPDIVTLGKPMGNGFPVAGLVGRLPLMETFGRDTRYFNTFGGNGVAIAAAQATLDILRDEGLIERCETVGRLILVGLHELATRHEHIGDVRGTGLYIGVEFVSERASRQADAALTAQVVNGLRNRYVLVSSTGRFANVVKIRPPLAFSESDATRFLDALDDVLGAIE